MANVMDYCQIAAITRLLLFALIALIALSVVNFDAATAQTNLNFHGQPLTFLTWSEYLDPEAVSTFEQRFNAEIDFVYYESDDNRTEMLVANDGRGYDLILTSGLDIQSYHKRGWLAAIDASLIPNLKHVEDRWTTAFPVADSHAVPYFWGTLGIAYRRDLVTQPITSWRQLLSPADQLRGKIVMNRSSRDLTAIALKALGYSINSTDSGQLKQAERLLQAQRPYVKEYGYVAISEQSALVSGDVWVSMIYSGDALMLKEHHDEIVYVVPEEGSNIWVDYLAILQTSTKKELAAAFIDFLNEPRVAARNAEFVYYATPNKVAKAYLPDEYFANPVIYPGADYLARSEFYRSLSPRAQKRTNMIMANLLNYHAAR